jgi:hypothetical protein
MEWSFQTAEELVAALRAGAVTSVELTDEAIARIERDDEVINAICVPDFDRARAAAHRADQARARGEDWPLLGIPVTVKESYNIAGLPTTWGMPPHRNYMPAEDAVQVLRRYLRVLARFLTEEPAGKVLLALIGEAQHDAETARIFHQRYLDPQRQREREMLGRAVTAGQLSGALDVDAALDALCGPIVYRALTGVPIPRSFVDGLVTDILDRHVA